MSAEDFDPDRDVLFDIPVDENTAEMTCAIVELPDASDTDRLYDDTKSLYEKFDPTKVSAIATCYNVTMLQVPCLHAACLLVPILL